MSSPDASRDPGPTASWAIRFGSTVGAGVLAALLASLPVALRLGGGRVGSALGVWHVLVALALLPALVSTYIATRSRVGARIVVSGRVVELATVAFASFGALSVVLAIFGALRRAKTHHRGLGGTTFALVALVAAVGVVSVVTRAVTGLASRRTALRVLLIATSLLALFSLTALARQLTADFGHPWTRPLMDVLALVLAAGLASGSALGGQRVLAIVGVPAAVVLLAIGYASLRAEPGLLGLMADGAPLHAWIARHLISPAGG